jgi:hypothetical protein
MSLKNRVERLESGKKTPTPLSPEEWEAKRERVIRELSELEQHRRSQMGEETPESKAKRRELAEEMDEHIRRRREG